MKRQVKLLLGVLMLAAMLMSGMTTLAGVPDVVPASPAQDGGRDYSDITLVYVTPLLSMSPDWSRSHEDFLRLADELGFDGQVVGPNEVNIEQMIADLETAIAEGADGIITCPLVPEAFEDVLGKAQAAGIPVVNVMADCCQDKRLTFIGTDPEALGQAQAAAVIEESGGDAKVGIIMTDATTPNQSAELAAIQAAFDAIEGIDIVDIQYDHSQVSEAVEKSAAMLTANPEIDFLICIEGACPNGVGVTLEEMDMVGKVKVLAIDLQPGTIDFIKDGVIWASFTQGYYNMNGGGSLAAQTLLDYIVNGTVPAAFIDSGYNFWTAENVDQYGQ